MSLLPLFGKVLERVVYEQLFSHVKPVLCPEQHGFIPKRSCISNLSVYLHSAWEAISDGYQTDAIYTDDSAAFQSVNHALVIHKLKQSYHLQDSALKWFVSYLSDRRQRVIVNGKTSKLWKPVISGVPEGSLLAPLIFSLFINDLPSVVHSGCLLYADDVKLYRKITSPADGLRLQEDLDRLTAWSVTWGLSLNPSKCKLFSMTLRRAPDRIKYFICNTELEHVSEIRDLGVIIDTKLTFAAHVNSTVRKGNRALGLLIRSFQTAGSRTRLKQSAVMAAYYANVRSILEYGSVIWAGAAKTHTERVDRVQHKFLMWASAHLCIGYSSFLYPDLLRAFKINSLASRRVQHDLLFIRNVVKNRVDSDALLCQFPLSVPARSTRSQNIFAVPRARVNTVQCGLFYRIPRLVNSFLSCATVKADIFADSFYAYKNCVLKYVSTL